MRLASLIILAVLAGGCGDHDPDDMAIPLDVEPCAEPEWWPNAARSATLPLVVRYPDERSAPRAAEMLALLEADWAIEVGELGFRAPFDRVGCAGDDAVDVFLWPGQEEAYVEAIAADETTPQDDWTTIMVLDPEGEFGGDALATTLAHELNHMCQAADDWDEPIAVLEATATYVEVTIEDTGPARVTTVTDFQAHPSWSFDHDDDYETWFMYGGELYLEVLAATRFAGDPAAIGALWQQMRNVADDDNEPDWADAVRAAVAPATLEDTFVDLAVWRWYVGDRDDGEHLRDADELPGVATAGTASPATSTVALGVVEPLASAYVELTGAGPVSVRVDGLPAGLAARLLALPGTAGADADELAQPGGVATLDLTAGPRTLAIVVVPTTAYDPEQRPTAAALGLTLTW